MRPDLHPPSPVARGIRPGLPGRRGPAGAGAFTLIEVILAISIATGLLIAALLFYRQAADLRGQILQESERLATIRLVLDRMANDLRAAQVHMGAGMGFAGGTDGMSFTRSSLTIPLPGAASAGALGGSDLTRVTFTTQRAQEGTNSVISGLSRLEEAPGRRRAPAPPVLSVSAAAPGASFANAGGTNLFSLGAEMTNRVGELLTDAVRSVRLRYWDGAAWLDGWTNAAPPPGVEIVIGTEPPSEEAAPDEHAPEVFRRVVYVPAGLARRKPELDAFGQPLSP